MTWVAAAISVDEKTSFAAEEMWERLVAMRTENPAAVALLVGLLLLTVAYYLQPSPSVILSPHRAVAAWFGRLYLQCRVFLSASGQSRASPLEPDATVTGVFLHPVKSLRAVSVDKADLDTKGFVGDRRFMLATPAPVPAWDRGPNDPTHRFITQRQCPSFATVVVAVDDQERNMTLSSYLMPGGQVVISTVPAEDAPVYRSTLWGDVVLVQDLGDEAAEFLQKIVNKDEEVPEEFKDARSNGVRLVVQSAACARCTDEQYTPTSTRSLWTGKNPSVALTDGFPILLANEASLQELNRRLREKGKPALEMSRFRPNIVVKGGKPFEEDTWKVISIDDGKGQKVLLHGVKGCPRCKQSCTDQKTGKVTDEPLATLADFRAMEPGVPENLFFAQNVIASPDSIGRSISVGATVHVLERGEPVWGS